MSIKEIDQGSIKFIASGEKISDIEDAIRELVDNAIDASAKVIEIRLARFGVDCIEVQDDGIGIEEQNFKSLGQRYHTSKISNYTKLQESLDTFGFRGEALSCLCHLAHVTITTKAKSSPTGTKLTFKNDGTIAKQESVARSDGTTVMVKSLFHSLPVRRRDLARNAKRQYDKVVKLLYEQVIARPQIKFTLCKKQALKKEKDFTYGGTTLTGVIITIFGTKVMESLMPIKQASKYNQIDQPNNLDNSTQSDDQSTTREEEGEKSDSNTKDGSITSIPDLDIKDFEATIPKRDLFFSRNCKSKFARSKPEYSIYGYISKVNEGRNSSDCQFIYVNKKPTDIPKLSKLINEIYRSYSNNQHPFYCLFIQVQSWASDFNVPRKRTAILQDENKLCDMVKESLQKMYSPYAPARQKSCPNAHIPIVFLPNQNGDSRGTKRELTNSEVEGAVKPKKQLTNCINNINQTDPAQLVTPDHLDKNTSTSIANDCSASDFVSVSSRLSPPGTIEISDSEDAEVASNISAEKSHTTSSQYFEAGCQQPAEADHQKSAEAHHQQSAEADQQQPEEASCQQPAGAEMVASFSTPPQASTGFVSALEYMNIQTGTEEQPSLPDKDVDEPEMVDCLFNQIKVGKEICKDGELEAKIEHIEDLGIALRRERSQRTPVLDAKEYNFAIHPKFNTVAEQELKFNLNKTSFESMQVIGQFNKGFILALLNKHIFIIDQHATDERANYEDQLDKSPFMTQAMVRPKPLYFNSIQERAIIDNLDEFRRRGFEFIIDESKDCGLRVLLNSTSICKGHGIDEHLAKEDLEELIDVAVDAPNLLNSYTLKKVRDVAATRACRKSVMIGDKLNWSQMDNIVSKMSALQNPWICAHNRPTIRHLMDTDWMTE